MEAIFLLKGSKDIFTEIYNELINDQDIKITISGRVKNILEYIIIRDKQTIADLLSHTEEEFLKFHGITTNNVNQLTELQSFIRSKYSSIIS